jgi:hypothetical protein
MLSLRFLLLLTFIGTNASAFASSMTFSSTEHSLYESDDLVFFDNNSAVLDLPNLKIEGFQPHVNGPKPKVIYGANQSENYEPHVKQLSLRFKYLKCSKTVYLKLPSFSIAFPFHCFP